MSNSSEVVGSPLGSNSISSYHAHVYWTRPEERVLALELREWIAQRFGVALGRVHDQPVGPHTQPMYQVWLGTALPIRGEVLPNQPGTDDISAPLVNTTPDRSSE